LAGRSVCQHLPESEKIAKAVRRNFSVGGPVNKKYTMWYVYILQSQKNWILYVGSTNDLKRRIKEHNGGDVISTKPNRPWDIESYIGVKTENQARSLEKYLKSGSGRATLRKRILGIDAK